MSNELNIKDGLKIKNTQPVTGITNTIINNDDNSLVSEGQIYRELTGITSNLDSHTGDTTIHFTKESLNDNYLNLSGGTITGNLLINGNLSGNTLYGDGSNLTGIALYGDYVNLSGDTMTGQLILPSLSATSISGDTYYGDGSNLTGIALYGDYVDLSGDTMTGQLIVPSLSATTISGGTYYGDGSNLTGIYSSYVDLSGDTMTGGLVTPSLSATTISGDTIYGDGSNLTGISGSTVINDSTLSGNTVSDVFDNAQLPVETTVLSGSDVFYIGRPVSGSTADTKFITKDNLITDLDNRYVELNGDTMIGGLVTPSLSSTTISGDTLYGDGSNLTGIYSNYVNLSGGTMTGGLVTPSLSATTISGDTLYGDGSNLIGISTSFNDSNFEVYDNIDNTKKVKFELSGVTTGTTRELTVPDKDGTIALLSDNVWFGGTGIASIQAELANSTGNYAVAEGYGTIASNTASHAEGFFSRASGVYSHSEGIGTEAIGANSHSQGGATIAYGNYSHAGGLNSSTSGETSFIHSNNSIIYTGASNSSILGGSGNTINANVTGTTILGGSNIVGTTNNTVYGVNANFNTYYGNGSNLTGIVTQSEQTTLKSYTKEETGFVYPELVNVSYNKTGRTVTITSAITALYQGKIIPQFTGTTWTSDPHPSGQTTTQFLYYNGIGFTWSSIPWTFDKLQICATVYMGPALGFRGVRESHGLMPWEAHREFHEQIGTYLVSGGGSQGIVLGSTTVGERRPSTDSMVLADEDLLTTNPSIVAGSYPRMWLSGTTTSPVNNFSLGNTDIISLLGNNPYYNQSTGGNWVQTLVPNNGHISVYRLDIPATSDSDSQAIRSVWVQGQILSNGGNAAANATALANQLALNPSTLNLGNFSSTEYRLGYQYVIRYSSGNWSVVGQQLISGNRSNPISIQGGGLTSVSHGPNLLGSGTLSDPLLLNPSITATTISATTISGGTLYGNGSNLTNLPYTANEGVKINGYNISLDISGLTESADATGNDFLIYQHASGGTHEKVRINNLPTTTDFRFSLPENISNTSVYFYSWVKTSTATTLLRSGNASGISFDDSCSPIQIGNDGTITSASLTLKGGGVQSGTPNYPVEFDVEVWAVGFTGEGITRGTISFSISDAYTIGSYSPGDTNFSGVENGLSVQCYAGDLLALKFINGNADNKVGQMLNAFVSLQYKNT